MFLSLTFCFRSVCFRPIRRIRIAERIANVQPERTATIQFDQFDVAYGHQRGRRQHCVAGFVCGRVRCQWHSGEFGSPFGLTEQPHTTTHSRSSFRCCASFSRTTLRSRWQPAIRTDCSAGISDYHSTNVADLEIVASRFCLVFLHPIQFCSCVKLHVYFLRK